MRKKGRIVRESGMSIPLLTIATFCPHDILYRAGANTFHMHSLP